jgi:hypothetical protein
MQTAVANCSFFSATNMVVLLEVPSCFVVSHPENTVHTGCIRCWSLKARCNKRRCLSTCAIGGSLHESRRSQNLASTPSPDFHTNLIKSKRNQVWWHLAVAATRTNPELAGSLENCCIYSSIFLMFVEWLTSRGYFSQRVGMNITVPSPAFGLCKLRPTARIPPEL